MYKDDWTPDIGDKFYGRIKRKTVLIDTLLLSLSEIIWLDTSDNKFPRSSIIIFENGSKQITYTV